MKPEEMQRVLRRNAIRTEVIRTYRNGIETIGLRVCTGTNVSPVLYFDQNITEAQMLQRIDKAMRRQTAFRTEAIWDRQLALDNCVVCVQRPSSEPLIKRQFENLETYVRVCLPDLDDETDNEYSIRVTADYLDCLGIPEQELWDTAIKNTRENLVIRDMGEVLTSFGLPLPEESIHMFVGGTKDCLNGASILLYGDLWAEFCRRNGYSRLLILPSSVHEVMAIPDIGLDGSLHELVRIVGEINETCVSPEERLIPATYRYTLETNTVRLVATLTEAARW